ncbi:MAG TPA: YciI family protein [Gemmatimonadaceae bacterium]|jgi:hypothetical protein|nr:YciI family protein [Gemmatimonadaceae bacterium]
MSQFMLLLHEDPADARAMSPEEMQRVIEEYSEWSRKLAAEHRLVRGVKLRDEGGRHVRPSRREGDGVLVTDGPYVEGKEVIGGYFVVEAPDYDGASAIARECPHLAHGWVEVRAIDPV